MDAAESHHVKTGWVDLDSYSPASIVEFIQDDGGTDIGMALSADFTADAVAFNPTTGEFTASNVQIKRTPQVEALPEVLRASGDYIAAWKDIFAEWASMLDQIGDIVNPTAGVTEIVE